MKNKNTQETMRKIRVALDFILRRFGYHINTCYECNKMIILSLKYGELDGDFCRKCKPTINNYDKQ